MKHKDDSLEWHDENELVRRLDVVEAVLNLADDIDDVVDVIMSVPTYKVHITTNRAMGSDSISTKADRKTEPPWKKIKNYCDDCKHVNDCDSKEFFWACKEKVEDEPQTKYEKVKEAEHRMANIIANMDEPQTDCAWK